MPVRPSMVRATALVAVAALALHELRYLIGYGGRSPEALESQGHEYLPLVGALAGALLAIYAGQETVEGFLSSGHPGGLDAVAADGGLVAVPLAVALGGLVALGLRTASLAVAAAARRARPAPRRTRPRIRRQHLHRPVAGVLALNLAGRAPPAHR